VAGLALTQPTGIGLGLQEPFIGATPAAGAGFTFTCDGFGVRRLQTLVVQLVTSSAVAARYLTVEWIGADGNAYAVAAVTATQAASLTNRYVFGAEYGGASFNTGTDGFAALPRVYLMPGDQLKILVANIDTGDQLSKIRGVMERYPIDGSGLPGAGGE